MYGQPFSPEYIQSKSDEEFAAEITQTLRSLQSELRTRQGKALFNYPPENA
jgi:hypothetical protein